MNIFQISRFKCTVCCNWFCPPFNLPYLLKCAHSVCSQCLQNTVSSQSLSIICPEDLESSSIKEIQINQSTKQALERLMQQHKNYSQNSKLQSIKALSLSFDNMLAVQEERIQSLKQLLEQIFQTELKRIKKMYMQVMMDLEKPNNLVKEWKQQLQEFLVRLRQNYQHGQHSDGLWLYVEEGRRIRMQLTSFFKSNLDNIADSIIQSPKMCFNQGFSVWGTQKDTSLNLKAKKMNCNHIDPNYSQNSSDVMLSKTQSLTHQRKAVGKQNSDCKKTTKQPSLRNYINLSNLEQTNRFENMDELFKDFQVNKQASQQLSDQDLLSNQYFTKACQSKLAMASKDQRHCNGIATARQSGKTGQFRITTPERIHTSEDKLKNNVDYDQAVRAFHTMSVHSDHKTSEQAFQANNEDYLTFFSGKQQEGNISKTVIAQCGGNEGHDDLLLEDKLTRETGCKNEKINFIREWEAGKARLEIEPSRNRSELGQRNYYDCEKEKINYIRRMHIQRAEEAFQNTLVKENHIELINYSLQDVDMGLYLPLINWRPVEILKFVKTGISDQQFNDILNYLLDSRVSSLVVSGNSLSEAALGALLYFVELNHTLRSIYLTNNYINTLKSKPKISLLKQKGLTIYI